MREIDNNTTNKINFNGVSVNPSAKGSAPAGVEVTDLRNMPVAGRSQVRETSLRNDLAFLNNNQRTVEACNYLVDTLMNKGVPYEEAVSIALEFGGEFFKN